MVIDIRHPNGRMSVVLEQFFPETPGKIKKLLKVIDMDQDNRDEHIRMIREWMAEEIMLCESKAKEYSNKYIDIRAEVRELEPKVIIAGGYTNRLHKNSPEYIAAREKHKQLKKEFSRLKGLERSYNSSFNKYVNRKGRLQKNQELLK